VHEATIRRFLRGGQCLICAFLVNTGSRPWRKIS
jgi:hypothetical protein